MLGGEHREVSVIEQLPLAPRSAVRALINCVLTTAALLVRTRVHQPRDHLGQRLHFADGTAATVYRETVVTRPPTADPAVLVVCFRLRGVRSGPAHALFRLESVLNTPLFVGFPGFVSKLWLAHDSHGVYRGLYEWDGAGLAEDYVRALWRVLALVSVRGSIHYQILPGLRRDDLLRDPGSLSVTAPGEMHDAWRLVG
jgi:hypothetical protein